MPNLQVIEKQVLDHEGRIQLHHVFSTIQGEGPFTGTPAIFVRVAGCNLQCPNCDTDYTSLGIRRSQTELHKPSQIVYMVSELAAAPHLVVISGGEPFRQNIKPLVHMLVDAGYYVQIETNGTLFVNLFDHQYDEGVLTIVCSPKTGKLNPYLLPHINCFKYIIDAEHVNPNDGLPMEALGHAAFPFVARPPPGFDGQIYVQPMDTGTDWKNVVHVKAAIHSAMKYNYILSMQMHKIIGLE
jgi:organic radical activating enzyme